MDSEVILIAPPHLDHWSIALVWIVTEFCHQQGLDNSDDYQTSDRTFGIAYRAIVRCHPTYERFAVSSAIGEDDLVSMLVDKAQGTVRATRDLAKLPEAHVIVRGLESDMARDLSRYGKKLLPEHFRLTTGREHISPTSCI